MSDEPTPAETLADDPIRPAFLTTVRTEPRKRYAALTLALVVGLGAAWVHWLGLVVAGALVGLVSRTVSRAVAAGLGVGVAALALTVLASPTMGPGEFLALTPPAYVAIGAGLVAPALGSLIRGVI
jgi:short subunit fatty acids transporter